MRTSRRPDAAGVYDVNLDAGTFCVLRAGQRWERYTVNGEYTFDDDGREALYWPEPEEAAARLGLPELAEALRQGKAEPHWELRM